MLLIDKYRPKKINEFAFHKNILELLTKLSKCNEIQHIIFYGPSGCGKKTIVNMLLELLYDETVHDTKPINYKVSGSGSSKIIEEISQSHYHIEIEPHGTNYDRYLIQTIVREYIKRRTLNIFKTKKHFKTVLINNIDNLSQTAQTSLRQTMERHLDKCRFVMWCEHLSRVIKPIQSRCLCIRIPAPENNELIKFMFDIAYREKINLTFRKISEILSNSNGNIKSILWGLQFTKVNCEEINNYNKTISKIVKLLETGRIESDTELRAEIFKILIANYDVNVILRSIIKELCNLKTISDDIKYEIIEKCADFENRLTKSRREILQLDGFLVNVLSIIGKNKVKNK